MSKIAVVIVTYNGLNWIEKCIDSIQKSTIDCTIFVVDNASSDDTIGVLNQFEDIEIVLTQTNLGFGKANNIGIKKALANGFEQFFLINQDTYIESNTIEKLSESLQKNKEFGILSPLHFAPNTIDLDENFCKYYKKGIAKHGSITEVPFVNAAAWLVSKTSFESVGLFEPAFSHYGEDRNFCDRAAYHGFRIGILDHTKIVHDRKTVRSFQKDVIQSEYLILNSLININLNATEQLAFGLKQVFGLPKYFIKFYGFTKSTILFWKLLFFYSNHILHFRKLNTIIRLSKLGKNGF